MIQAVRSKVGPEFKNWKYVVLGEGKFVSQTTVSRVDVCVYLSGRRK